MASELNQKISAILKFKITTKLLGSVLLVMGTTVMIVHVPWLVTSRRNIDDIVDYVNNKVTQGTEHEVDRIFNNVTFAHRFIEEAFHNQINLKNSQERELFYLNFLASNPGFSWLQFGFPDGDFFGANRVFNDLSVVNRDWNEAKKSALKTSIFYTKDAQGNLRPKRTEITSENFYSPQRPWYKAALLTPGEIVWSDVYIFRTSRTPGISSGLVLQDPQTDTLLGVVSIAFELKQISVYLENYEKNGQFVFLINQNRELIASSSVGESTYKVINNEEFELKRLEESENIHLQIANQAVKLENIDFTNLSERRSFRYQAPGTNNKFFVSFAPLGSQDWIIGTIIPESVYLTEIQRNRQILIVVLSSTIFVTSIVVFYVAKHWLANPIIKITHAATAIERGNFNAIALDSVMKRTDEIGHLAQVFSRMAQEVYGREQELKQQVTQLQVEIDETKRTKEVQEIVESDFFKDLQQKAKAIRQRRHQGLS